MAEGPKLGSLMTTKRPPSQLTLDLPIPRRGEASRQFVREVEVTTAMTEPESLASAKHLIYGFQPGRSAQQAVAQAQAYVTEGHQFVVDIYLAKFFDRVNHANSWHEWQRGSRNLVLDELDCELARRATASCAMRMTATSMSAAKRPANGSWQA